MVTVVFTTCLPYFSKNAANFLEISRKYLFTAANTCIIKNRVGKKLKQILSRNYSFRFQTLICIINFAEIISDDVIQLTSRDVFSYHSTGTESFILIASTLQFLGGKNLRGGPFDPPPPTFEG